MNFVIRPARASDISAIGRLGAHVYPSNYYEDEESFISKVTRNLTTCWVAEVDSYIVAYLIAFPYVLNRPYPINAIYVSIENPDCLYIHDLCVSERFRNFGIARKLTEQVLNCEWNNVALVSVMRSKKFWENMGFTAVHQLDYCGLPGTYMVRTR